MNTIWKQQDRRIPATNPSNTAAQQLPAISKFDQNNPESPQVVQPTVIDIAISKAQSIPAITQSQVATPIDVKSKIEVEEESRDQNTKTTKNCKWGIFFIVLALLGIFVGIYILLAFLKSSAQETQSIVDQPQLNNTDMNQSTQQEPSSITEEPQTDNTDIEEPQTDNTDIYTWNYYEGYEFFEEGDVYQLEDYFEMGYSLDELQQMVEEEGWSGFVVSQSAGVVWFKKVDYELDLSHLSLAREWIDGIWLYTKQSTEQEPTPQVTEKDPQPDSIDSNYTWNYFEGYDLYGDEDEQFILYEYNGKQTHQQTERFKLIAEETGWSGFVLSETLGTVWFVNVDYEIDPSQLSYARPGVDGIWLYTKSP